METRLSSSPSSIQISYENYLNGNYVVNRRYQRKLVWTIGEKAAFIDSIHRKFSVPLFLLAKQSEDGERYEIIDGMQRLNAIFAFIENEFYVILDGEKGYFDLQTLASTKNLKDKGKIRQKTPVLPRNVCMGIVSYQLSFSYVVAEQKNIEEMFRRINSFGRQLSSQELRQAGTLGVFPDMVRRISARIRGDVSQSDKIRLNDMERISLTNKYLGYGIDMSKTFWVKYNIITVQNMRLSRDEEIVAHILAYIIMNGEIAPSANVLDALYRFTPDDVDGLAVKVEDKIKQRSEKIIEDGFFSAYTLMLNVLDDAHKDFRALVLKGKQERAIVRDFQVIFLAFYEFLARERKEVFDMQSLVHILSGIATVYLGNIASSDNWNQDARLGMVRSIKGVISQCFRDRAGADDVSVADWASELDNMLHLSVIEGSQYDFKAGFHDLSNGKFNEKLVLHCVEVLTAEVNKYAKTKGYVIVGVAESESTASQFKNKYGVDARKVDGTKFYVVGLNEEIRRYYRDGDDFLRQIKRVIKTAPVEKRYIDYILMNMRLVRYYEKDVPVLELQSDSSPVAYGDAIHIREGNDTHKLDMQSVITLSQRFQNDADWV